MNLSNIFSETSFLSIFLTLTGEHPLLMGFLKFAFFASLGELLSVRLALKKWVVPQFFPARVFLWGLVGVAVAFSFDFYSLGVKSLQSEGKLPWKESFLAFAFFTSFFNNITFAPLMMASHKYLQSLLNLFFLGKGKFEFERALDEVDWKTFLKKVCLWKIPFFWIPIHTLTFLLPDAYRVLFAAALSFLLGVFLSVNLHTPRRKTS